MDKLFYYSVIILTKNIENILNELLAFLKWSQTSNHYNKVNKFVVS